jgi:hypothetical protein
VLVRAMSLMSRGVLRRKSLILTALFDFDPKGIDVIRELRIFLHRCEAAEFLV